MDEHQPSGAGPQPVVADAHRLAPVARLLLWGTLVVVVDVNLADVVVEGGVVDVLPDPVGQWLVLVAVGRLRDRERARRSAVSAHAAADVATPATPSTVGPDLDRAHDLAVAALVLSVLQLVLLLAVGVGSTGLDVLETVLGLVQLGGTWLVGRALGARHAQVGDGIGAARWRSTRIGVIVVASLTVVLPVAGAIGGAAAASGLVVGLLASVVTLALLLRALVGTSRSTI